MRKNGSGEKELIDESADLGRLINQACQLAATNASENRYLVKAPDRLLFQTNILDLSPMIVLMLRLITKYHSGQTRKGDGHPYLEHPLDVGQLLYDNGFEYTIIVAGYGHDLLEGTECPLELLYEEFGTHVGRTIEAVSHDSHEKDWKKKKHDYINKVEKGGRDAIAVSIADKVANLNSFIRQYQVEGASLWRSFNQGKENKLWFEKSVYEMAKRNWQHPLLDEYARLIQIQSQLSD